MKPLIGCTAFCCAFLNIIPAQQLSFIHNGQQLNPHIGGNVKMGDFNGDGNVDALAANRDYYRIYFGRGNGLFTDGGQCLSTVSSCAVGDINNDGRLEVITDRTIWLNDGDGHFAADARSVDSLEAEELGVAELADLNGDDYLDLFVIRGYAAMRVYFNDGTGHFQNSGQMLGDGTIGTGQLAHIALGDLNGDGAIDAVTAGWRWPPRRNRSVS
jgi:hypothetical protein